MVIVLCKICGRDFKTKPSFLKKGQGVYCSNACHYIDKKGKRINCSVCGKVVYRSISKLGNSKSGKYFCGKSCQTKWRNQEFSGPKSLMWKGGQSTYRKVISKSRALKVCALCKEGDLRVLAVHHIDKNRENYRVENLAWLCHNCHYLVHHDSVEMQKLMEALV